MVCSPAKTITEVGISSLLYNRQIKEASVVFIIRNKRKGPTITFVWNLSKKINDKNVNEMVKKSKSKGKEKALRHAYSFLNFDKTQKKVAFLGPEKPTNPPFAGHPLLCFLLHLAETPAQVQNK